MAKGAQAAGVGRHSMLNPTKIPEAVLEAGVKAAHESRTDYPSREAIIAAIDKYNELLREHGPARAGMAAFTNNYHHNEPLKFGERAKAAMEDALRAAIDSVMKGEG